MIWRGMADRNLAFDFKKEYREFYLPDKKPGIIAIPQIKYLAVRGQGDPNQEDGEYKQAMYIHQSHSNCQPVFVLKETVFLLIFLISIFESTLVFVYVHSVACRIKDTSGNI